MKHIHFVGIAAIFCLGLLFLQLPSSAAQDVSTAGGVPEPADISESEPVEPLMIKLSVNEVRLDVVVIDKKTGDPVADLTAADFEVLQGNKRQTVVSSVYIENQSDAAAKPSSNRKDNRNLPSLPSADLKREDARRTIIVVVDDISMDYADCYYAKMALRNFVEKQMQSGDIVAILKTSYGNSALQMFLSDKREALARIDTLRLDMTLSLRPDGSHLYRVYDNQLSTLSYSLRALKDMPGRKILIMITAQTGLRKPDPSNSHPWIEIDFHALYNEPFIRLSDDALRAGVVVNFLNIGGLINNDPMVDASRNLQKIYEEARRMEFNRTSSFTAALIKMELDELERKQSPRNALNPLPIKTGGITIENSNFFLDGIGKETESLMKGYYLVSYAPPADTFSSGDKEIFNQVKINVKRKNVDVYTRDGFYNRLESRLDPDTQAADSLQDAIFSPFLHADLNVNMAAGYVNDAKAGYFIRSWIHIDPKDLKIIDMEDGSARIDLEAFCLTSDINGFVQDSRRVYFALSNIRTAENMAWIQKHGIRFAMLLPVKKPGSYYVRIAVKNAESSKVGSAYQFVEILDVGKSGPVLSSIFMITSDQDLNWIRSDVTSEIDKGVFLPVFQRDEVRSPALRTYAPGDRLQTLAVLYNADEKAIADSEIEMQSILYRDGIEFMRNEQVSITPDKVKNPNGIEILQGLMMGIDMPSGDYALQLIVTDKRNSKKPEGNASQFLSFTIAEK